MRQVKTKAIFKILQAVATGRKYRIVGLWVWLVWGPLYGFGQEINRNIPAIKMAPILQNKAFKSANQQYRVQVSDPVKFMRWLQQELPEVQIRHQPGPTNTLLLAKVKLDAFHKLVQSPQVKFVDVPDRKPHEELLLSHSDLTANKIRAVHEQYPELKGAGFVASIKESPFDTTDLDLKKRIIHNPALNNAPTTHATTMATLVAGGANSGPRGQGVAPAARLASSDFSNLMPDANTDFQNMGISVQNHSYGVNPENYYGLEAQAYDQQTQENPHLLHVFSAGNAGTEAITTGPYANMPAWANLTGQFKLSKNTLSVGATDTSGQLSPISSRGPAYDGRIKPELVAFGEGGTSESAALVSGMALLVQQAYQKQTGTLPTADLVKAALINSADRLGNSEVNFKSGFGQADALGAITTIRNKQYFTGQVNANELTTYQIRVPENSNFLRITLVWSDPAGEPGNAKALVNDLDVTATQLTTRQQWLPWVLSSYPHPDSLTLPPRRAADHLNNVEQITLAKPATGIYEIKVKGYQITQGPQVFSLVYEVQPVAFTWNYPGKNSWLPAGERNRVCWENQINATSGKLEYRFLPHGNWQLITESAGLTKTFLDWRTPDTTALAQLRLTTGNTTALSDTFGIVRPVEVQIGFNCGDEAMMYWTKQAGVSEYQIWQLGTTYLEPFRQTTDTVLVLNKNQSSSRYYAVSPLLPGITPPKSYTVDYSQGACYIKSFLPQQLVTDTIALDVTLTTNYGLQSISLEKQAKGSFQTVQTVSPVNQLSFTFPDASPVPGRNEYRVKVTTQNQQDYYSQIEGVFFTPPRFVQLFPNPVARGAEVSVVIASDADAQIKVFDSLGRQVQVVTESGVIKTISTADLKPGVYMVRVQNYLHESVTTRLVVL